jgi:hypothetical protein
LYMNEQLRDMGQNIATKITMNWFIWKPNISLQKNQVWATCANAILWYIFLSNFQMKPQVLALFEDMKYFFH